MSCASDTAMLTKPISCRAAGRAALQMLLASAVASSACAGGLPIGSTPGEVSLLPAYCMDTSSFGYGVESFNPSPRAGHWVGLMGKSFWHMHHYCYGLIKARRATFPGASPSHRKFMLENAINEFDYVITNSPADFIMLPEVFRMRGDVQLKLGRLADANDSYAVARRLKPDYAPAYINWADELVRTGLKKNALALLEDGLRAARESKDLRTGYAKLGGNVEAFIKALPAASVSAEAASAPALAAASERPASSTP